MMEELIDEQTPEKKEKIVELECTRCGFKELRKVGDSHIPILNCPMCWSKLTISGVYEGQSIDPSVFEGLKEIVERYIKIDEIRIENKLIVFKVNKSDYHRDYYTHFASEFRRYERISAIRKSEEKEKINIIAMPTGKEEIKKRDVNVNIILFIVTLITTTWAGYILAGGNLLEGFLFGASLLFIIGIHELGHMTAARKHGIDYSFPYFIPAPPISPFVIGTFGAVISSRSPTSNRNALFDLGASGPLAGFIVTIIVLIIGLMMSDIVPTTEVGNINEMNIFNILFPPPLMLFLIGIIFGPSNFIDIFLTGNLAISYHPIVLAGWVGAIVTMLNLMPAGFLDGGHILRSLLDTKSQKMVSYLVAFITFLLGWWLMALIMLLISAAGHPGPLDDVSELSTRRKLFSIVIILILLSCITIPVIPSTVTI